MSTQHNESLAEKVIDTASNGTTKPIDAAVKIGPMNTGLLGLAALSLVAITGIRAVYQYKVVKLGAEAAKEVVSD